MPEPLRVNAIDTERAPQARDRLGNPPTINPREGLTMADGTIPRKPPTPMESRDPHSIRFTPTEWDAITDEARGRGLEPAVFVRMLTMYALEDVTRATRATASLGMPSQVLASSPRTRRF